MSIYEKIKLLANEKKLTIKDIESRCGLSNGLIKKWEKSIPKADLLYAVSKELDVSIEYFLSDDYSNNFLTEDETNLITQFRSLDYTGRINVAKFIIDEIRQMNIRKSDSSAL